MDCSEWNTCIPVSECYLSRDPHQHGNMKAIRPLLVATMLSAAAAQAQSPFSYEAGVLANLTRYEEITRLDLGLGLGGNVSVYLLKRLAVDASIDFSPNKSDRTGNSLTIQNFRTDLIYNQPLAGKWRGMIGAGWTGTQFRGDKTKNEYDSGLNGMLGLRYCASANWSWTAALIGDYKDPADQTPAFNSTMAWSVRVGLNRFFGANRSKGPCVEGEGEVLPPPPPAARTPESFPPAQPQPAQQPPAQPQQAPAQQAPAQRPPAQQPAAQPAPAPRPLMTFAPIYFDFDRATLSRASRDTLDGIVRFMTANPSANVQVTGYTDDRGSDDYNATLGARRATVTKDYLVSKGISANRITTATRGEQDPAESNATAEGRARNRRAVGVEVRP
jgi:outer membrane protein OmpA-like peptidoglycan-associated protein